MTITLANLHEKTPEEVLGYIAYHLFSQGKQAMNYVQGVSMGCNYKTSDNLKCAAGCLIGDDEYNSDFEGSTWTSLVARSKVPKEHCELIFDCQVVHDSQAPSGWYKSLCLIAKHHGISEQVVDDAYDQVGLNAAWAASELEE